MKIYLVGGAVRDKILGIKSKERDWVVVNGSSQELIKLGYKQVGKNFPVFLHPVTSEEYALARIEKKIKEGHKGFEFNTSNEVTLEEDLSRRDLTINAIAEDENGNVIDPYNGIKDIEDRTLRHVSKAFTEDPLRVFRVARFYARFHEYDFNVHESTYEVMQEISKSGEIETLSKERLWGELSRALNTKNPWAFFDVLIKSKVAEKYFPEILESDLIKEKLIYFSNLNIDKDMYLSICGLSLNIVEFFGFPKKILDLYFIFNEFGAKFISLEINKDLILLFLNSLDAFRRPARLKIFLEQINLFTKYHKMNEDKKIDIFYDILNQIENKIDYGDMANLSVNQIKDRISRINLNIIDSILNKK